MHVILLIHVVYADIKPMHILCWTVPSICQRTAEQQPLHMSSFLRVIYAILNASVILERNETRLARNEKRLARNEARLARNETRGGNLLLSGTVYRDSIRYIRVPGHLTGCGGADPHILLTSASCQMVSCTHNKCDSFLTFCFVVALQNTMVSLSYSL